MHVPDGFLDAPTSIATGVAAATVVGYALRGARRELDERTAPLAGLVAAFVFAAQMINFPVAAGTSGHIMGGALAAILVGPWTGLLCVTVVVAVQALMFADGGVTALGSNTVLIAIVPALVGYAAFLAVRTALPKRPASVPPAAFAAALISVPATAMVFVALYAFGGAVPVPLELLAGSMFGWHVLIGTGEALISFAAVGSVIAVRPDLVYGARPLLEARELEIRTGVDRREVAA